VAGQTAALIHPANSLPILKKTQIH